MRHVNTQFAGHSAAAEYCTH